MTQKSDIARNWILIVLTLTTILFGGSLIATPFRVSAWIRTVSNEQIEKRVRPLEVSLNYIISELKDLKQLVKESLNRELARGRRR